MKKVLARLARVSPAMIVAMLALFVALAGTAVATTSVVITGKQIKNNSITGADVKNKSLTPRDFRGSVRGPRGLRGATGATGATGAAGAAGAKGDKGDKGDIGPSDAYSRFRDGPVTLAFFTKPSIAHLDLPAGNFVVFAKAWIDNVAGSGASDVECDLVLSTGDFDRGRVGLDDQNVGPAKRGTMALNVVGTLAAAGGVDLNCRNFGGGSTQANFIKITAIKVGTLTNTAQT